MTNTLIKICVIAILTFFAARQEMEAAEPGTLAKNIISSAGVKSGLCIHIGCGDGALTAKLSKGGKFLVHGLATDRKSRDKARQLIQSTGNYGRISVACSSLSDLPYTDNLVNLVVADNLPELMDQGLSLKEVMRVLCPNGVAYLGQRQGTKRPLLTESKLRGMLKSAGIKGFTIVTANGIWARIQKPWPAGMDEWTHWRHGPDGNKVSQDTIVDIPTRLKWIDSPAWARTHASKPLFMKGSSRAMVSSNGRTFYVGDTAPRGMAGPMILTLTARDAFNGLILWKRTIESVFPFGLPKNEANNIWNYYWYEHRYLVAEGDRVYSLLKQGGPLVALNAVTGEIVRTYDKAGSPREVVYYEGKLILVVQPEKRKKYSGSGPICCLEASTGKLLWKADKEMGRHIIVVDGQVFFGAGGEIVCLDLATGKEKWRKAKPKGAKKLEQGRVLCLYQDGRLFLRDWLGGKDDLYAVSAKDGSLLWSYPYRDFNGYTDIDVYFVGGLVWVQVKGESWAMVGLDPATGKEKKRVNFPEQYPKTRGHHRCHPNKATKRYFLLDTHGLDFIDWQAEKVYDVRFCRGNCYFGILPANGLLYLPPNPCGCGRYLRGFVALAPSKKSGSDVKIADAKRLEEGAAYGMVPEKTDTVGKDEWPLYRHDSKRSGSTLTGVSPDLKLLWDRKVGESITSPTIAENMVFLASKNTHQVHALDAKTGEPCWSYTAGGPVDSPPAIYAGLAIFGCKDGWVYCLRAKDGKLVWRFLAAPRDQRIIAFGQLESTWPVHGSVLIDRGIAYFGAGRFSELDGGIHVYAIDPIRGKVIWRNQTSSGLSDTLKGKVWHMRYWKKEYIPMRSNDIFIRERNFVSMDGTAFLVEDGKSLWRGGWRAGGAGMLDGSWIGRTRWQGKGKAEMFVFDGNGNYGFLTSAGRYSVVNPGKSEYKLFAKGAREWSLQVPLRVRAMALAADTLFTAGTPDVIDEKDYWAAHYGKKGGELWAHSTVDGKKLNSVKLKAAPVFDGMAAAYSRIYISGMDGKLRCFGKE